MLARNATGRNSSQVNYELLPYVECAVNNGTRRNPRCRVTREDIVLAIDRPANKSSATNPRRQPTTPN